MFASTQDLEFVQGQSRDVPDRELALNMDKQQLGVSEQYYQEQYQMTFKILPKLIQRLYSTGIYQEKETERAIISKAEFILASEYQKYTIPANVWLMKTNDERNRILTRFFSEKTNNSRTSDFDRLQNGNTYQ